MTASRAIHLLLPVYTTQPGATTIAKPTLWYSPDCSLAAYVDATGAPATPLTLNLIDMTNGQHLGSQMAFSGAFPELEVVATQAGQSVQVTFSPTDVRTATIP